MEQHITAQKSKGMPIRDKQRCESKNCEQRLFGKNILFWGQCKEAVQERRAAEKKERNRLHCQQNQEKIIERVKERRREIRESTNERTKHTRRTVKGIMQKKAVKQGRDEAHAKDLTRNLRKSKPRK